MKYKYEPNCHIVDYENNRTKFIFDENGEFETDDPKLIDWIRKNKNFLKPVEENVPQAPPTDPPIMPQASVPIITDSPFMKAYYAYVNNGQQPGEDAAETGAPSSVSFADSFPQGKPYTEDADAGAVKSEPPAGTEIQAAATDPAAEQKPESEAKTYHCSKCEFVGASLKEISAHAKAAHPKPKEDK
jgi:hypothetical protein